MTTEPTHKETFKYTFYRHPPKLNLQVLDKRWKAGICCSRGDVEEEREGPLCF